MKNHDRRFTEPLNTEGRLSHANVDKNARIAITTLTTGETVLFPLPHKVLQAPFEARSSVRITDGATAIEWPALGSFGGYRLSVAEILTYKRRG